MATKKEGKAVKVTKPAVVKAMAGKPVKKTIAKRATTKPEPKEELDSTPRNPARRSDSQFRGPPGKVVP